ncbi:FAD-dependent oxidoreductase, partial [Spirillospora sp. NPDC029432]|uniref:FAD-dependent oxidoreductase n=1 Tax=Spirillospora sp. NPDC029432 TaxID=3154599 RepID=UPI003452DFC1
MSEHTPRPGDQATGCCGSAAAPVPDVEQPATTLDTSGTDQESPVVVIGAGPIGLAAAAHLAERRLPFLVLEAGERAGAAVAEWGHVRLFSPWRYNIDAAARRLLEATGWTPPPADALPTGAELIRDYLAPLAALPELAGHIRTGTRVVAVTRQGVDATRTIGRDEHPLLVR